jgi:hypothetical protein
MVAQGSNGEPGFGATCNKRYWFTASTSFANPAVTLARSLTDTFVGIRPVDSPASSSRNLQALRQQPYCFVG